MAQHLTLCTALAEDRSLVHGALNYSSRGSDTIFWLPWVILLTYVYTHSFEKEPIFKPFDSFLFSYDKEQIISMFLKESTWPSTIFSMWLDLEPAGRHTWSQSLSAFQLARHGWLSSLTQNTLCLPSVAFVRCFITATEKYRTHLASQLPLLWCTSRFTHRDNISLPLLI